MRRASADGGVGGTRGVDAFCFSCASLEIWRRASASSRSRLLLGLFSKSKVVAWSPKSIEARAFRAVVRELVVARVLEARDLQPAVNRQPGSRGKGS